MLCRRDILKACLVIPFLPQVKNRNIKRFIFKSDEGHLLVLDMKSYSICGPGSMITKYLKIKPDKYACVAIEGFDSGDIDTLNELISSQTKGEVTIIDSNFKRTKSWTLSNVVIEDFFHIGDRIFMDYDKYNFSYEEIN